MVPVNPNAGADDPNRQDEPSQSRNDYADAWPHPFRNGRLGYRDRRRLSSMWGFGSLILSRPRQRIVTTFAVATN